MQTITIKRLRYRNITLAGILTIDYAPGQPRTEWDCGCPPMFTGASFYTEQIIWCGEIVRRSERPDWFLWADRIASEACEERPSDMLDLAGARWPFRLARDL